MASYKDSYTTEVAKKWKDKGGYAAYEAAAKAWNKKKYGTTEPTKRAESWGGGAQGKKNLAAAHKDIKKTIATADHGPGTFYQKDSGQSIHGMRAPGVKSYESPTYKAQSGSLSGGWVDRKTRAAKVFENPKRDIGDTNVGVQTLKAVNLSKNLNDPAQKTQQKTTTPSKTTSGKVKGERRAQRQMEREGRRETRQEQRNLASYNKEQRSEGRKNRGTIDFDSSTDKGIASLYTGERQEGKTRKVAQEGKISKSGKVGASEVRSSVYRKESQGEKMNKQDVAARALAATSGTPQGRDSKRTKKEQRADKRFKRRTGIDLS